MPENNGKTLEQFNSQIDTDLRIEFDKARAGLRLQIYEAVDAAIRLWLDMLAGKIGTGVPPVPANEGQHPPHNGELKSPQDKLHFILSVNYSPAVSALETNLDAFVDLSVRSKSGPNPGEPSKPTGPSSESLRDTLRKLESLKEDKGGTRKRGGRGRKSA